MKLGIIGGTGWLGSALGQAVIEQEIVLPQDLAILNRRGPQADYFGHSVVWPETAADLAAQCDVIVVSVRPQDWPDLPFEAKGKLLLSFMAGVGLSDLATTGAHAVRVMPNALAEIGRSYSPWVASEYVSAADKARVRGLLQTIGTEDELRDEAQLDLITATSGAGPAWPALMAQTMFSFLVQQGLPEGVAAAAVKNVICDAPRLAPNAEDAAQVVREFVDYDGTTAAGLNAAQSAGFAHALEAGLAAAVARAKRLGE